MDINKANIDEHLFEYFEGLMNPAQEDVLMGFIHQHPEYETDFVQWKKAYHHKSYDLEDYGIAKTVKKPLVKMPLFKPYYFFGVVALGMCMGWFLNSYDKYSRHNIVGIIHQPQESPKPKHVTVSPKGLKNAKIDVVPRSGSEKVIGKDSEEIKQALSVTVLDQPYEEQAPLELRPKNLEEQVLGGTLKVDSLELKHLSKKELGKKEDPKKGKKKVARKSVFSTTDQILPVNDNF